MVKSSSITTTSQRHDEHLYPDTDDNNSDSASQATSASRQPMHRRSMRKRKRRVMGLKSKKQRGNDPHDYEQKYPEDEPYKAMGPMARMWKVFLDECAEFNAEMVDDWRDTLDVLLVFAGLFSAVVTTFISQTSQKLQPDYTQITASKLSEVAELVRAAMTGGPEDVKAIPRAAETVASFKPDLTAVWVNGLWFTSLALSLATALLAVLTKQWIHQYMSVPSGTPRDRSHTRHYRFLNLERWHVPMVIGVLPVLLHLSLGIFFAGLVVFLHAINLTTSSVTTGIVALGFAAYFGTNLLPLFKPDCPYKTPLSLYSYGISMSIWNCFKRSTEAQLNADGGAGNSTPDGPTSLWDVEKEQVQQNADFLDARCLSWLYNTTSNSSVQSIAIQAFSDLPLRCTKIFQESVMATAQTIQDMVAPENAVPGRHSVRVRLTRAWYKFNNEEDPPRSAQDHDPLSIAFLTDTKHQKEAADFLIEEISNPMVEIDVLSWAVILRNALRSGTDWLDVHDPHSKVWATLVKLSLSKHVCLSDETCNVGTLMTMCVNVGRTTPGDRVYCTLSILDLPGVDEPMDFHVAVANFLLPSFSDVLWTLGYPSSAHSTECHSLPPQLRLHLDLFQTSYVRRGFNIGTTGTVMKVLIQRFKSYVGIVDFVGADVTRAHPTFSLATFHAVCTVVGSQEFTSGSFTLLEQCDVLHILFRLLVSSETSRIAFTAWLSRSKAKTIVDIVFADPHVIHSPLITDILEYTTSSKSQLLVYEVYSALSRREWIKSVWTLISLSDREKDPYHHAYPFMCSAFVDGLDVLKDRDLSEYQHTMDYITKHSNLIDLAVAILMVDVDKRESIRQLASIAGKDTWSSCCDHLRLFLFDQPYLSSTSSQSDIQRAFNYHANFMQGRHPYNFKVTLSYGKFADLADLVASTAYAPTNTSEGCVKRVPGWRKVVSGWIERVTASSESDDDNGKESV